MNCLHCGAPVLINDVCSECGLKQEYLIKAWNTSLYYYNIGLSDAKIRNLTGAEEALKTSLRYNKANVDARNLLGLVYYETGQVIEALAEWVISSNYQPEENLAIRYLKLVQGNQNKLSAFDQAAKKYNLTLHYAQQKNYDLALIQLKRVLNDNPHFVKAYLVLALIYIEEGNTEKAKKALQRVLKIDRYHPMALHYMEELTKNEKQYASGSSWNSGYEEPDGFMSSEDEPDEEEMDEEETAKRKIREIIERGAAAEDINPDQNLEVGSYKEIKYGRHNILYLIAGLVIGIAAMFFLIMPEWIERSEDTDLKAAYSAELSGKNVTIATLQDHNDKLQEDIDTLTAQMEAMEAENNEGDIEDAIMAGIQSYISGNKQEAITALGAIDWNSGDYSETTKTCIQTVVTGCEEELTSCRSAGMTAFSSEDYEEAIKQLRVFCNLKPDDVEARYHLAQAYENTGDIEAASQLYHDINERFPDSNYVTTDWQ